MHSYSLQNNITECSEIDRKFDPAFQDADFRDRIGHSNWKLANQPIGTRSADSGNLMNDLSASWFGNDLKNASTS